MNNKILATIIILAVATITIYTGYIFLREGCYYNTQSKELDCSENIQIVSSTDLYNFSNPQFLGSRVVLDAKYWSINGDMVAWFVFDGEKSYVLSLTKTGFYSLQKDATVLKWLESCVDMNYPPILPWYNIDMARSGVTRLRGDASQRNNQILTCDKVFHRIDAFNEGWACPHFNQATLQAYCVSLTDELEGKQRCMDIIGNNSSLIEIICA